MNSPREIANLVAKICDVRFGGGCGYAQDSGIASDGDYAVLAEVLAAAFSERVAVVRPTEGDLRQELARTVANTANRNVEQLSDGESYAVADGIISAGFFDEATNLLAEPASAVVRPTRDQIREAIAEVLFSDEVEDRAGKIADAVLALFGVAVSDSQPVRPTRDHAIATLLETEVWPLEWSYEDCRAAAERFADALIREFGVAVSDSQETPT